jgi:ATP-binding cassette subfamily B protein
LSDSKNKVKTGQVFNPGIIRRILGFITPYKSSFIISLVLTILLAGLTPLKPVLFQYMLDNQVGAQDIQGLRFFALLILGILILQTILYYFQNILTNNLAQKVM